MGKKIIRTIVYIILITGISLLLYPSIANWWNLRHQTTVVASFIEKTEDLSVQENNKIFEKAQIYNQNLLQKYDRFHLDKEDYKIYDDTLNPFGDGVMAFVEIDKLNLNLPIYHGVDPAVLQIAVGHLPGTSFPLGKKGSHAVVSGHTGLMSAKLFTEIDKLRLNDSFNIVTLGKTMTYLVDQIKVVLPNEMDDLAIDPNKDYVTLQTCTPYGVNTHRLLVRGVRTNDSVENINIISEAKILNIYIFLFIVNVLILILFLIIRKMIKIFEKNIQKREGGKNFVQE